MTLRSAPPPTVNKAINKIDNLNLRVLDRNIGNGLDLGRSQVHSSALLKYGSRPILPPKSLNL